MKLSSLSSIPLKSLKTNLILVLYCDFALLIVLMDVKFADLMTVSFRDEIACVLLVYGDIIKEQIIKTDDLVSNEYMENFFEILSEFFNQLIFPF